jgi:hypothetical protein
MRLHYILTLDPRAPEVFRFITDHCLTLEVHLNRTLFWVPQEGSVATEFALRFLDSCPEVLDHDH